MPDGIAAGLAILLSHCRTIGEAADAIRQQFHVVNSAVAIEIVREDADRTITLHLLCQGRHEPVQHSEMQLKMVLQLVSFLAGRAWTPEHVQLPFDRQSPLGRYEQEFGCPVAFGHGRTTFILGKEDADLPLEIDHTKLQKMVMRAFDSLAGRAPRSALEFPDEVARIVRGQLSRGHVSTSAVAGAMNLSTRSLQRRLFAHGVTLKSIIDAEKARLANPKPPEPSASPPLPAVRPAPLPTHVAALLIADAVATGATCPITLNPITTDTAATTPCGHVFDREALTTWIDTGHMTCPECNTQI
jgi:hypothetical protein